MNRLHMTLALVLFSLPAAAGATTVRVDFAGVIDIVEDPGELLASEFALSAPFRGHFEFDLDTLLDSSMTPFGLPPGLFLFPVVPFGITGPSTLTGSVSVGPATTPLGRFAPLGEAIFISSTLLTEAGQADIYLVPFDPFPAFATTQAVQSCSVALVDTSGTANPGGFYVPADLEAYDSSTFGCSLSGNGVVATPGGVPSGSFSGKIASWVVTPEPSGWLLLGSAAGLAAARRRSLS